MTRADFIMAEESRSRGRAKALREAERALDEGATSVTVGSKAEAEERFLFRYANEGGYRDTTGLSGKETRAAFGSKAGTYHWDIGPKNHPHCIDRLQIYTYAREIIRIYFP